MQFEDLSYKYNTGTEGGPMQQNRLYGVKELGEHSTHADDIEDQVDHHETQEEETFQYNAAIINTANNYGYTEIGELLGDDAEQIEEITCRVDSKISEIRRTVTSAKEQFHP